jgi:hypothetical protein
MITQSKLIEMFDYKNGQLLRKNLFAIKRYGIFVGSKSTNGYIETSINHKRFYLHRLIWLFHYGTLPKCIDHIDGNKNNNLIENLREATISQNSLNMKIRNNKKIPIKNVYAYSGGFEVKFCMNGIKKRFGPFKSIEDAKNFAIQYRKKHHKEFARHE